MPNPVRPPRSEFTRSLLQGAGIGLVLLAVLVPWIRSRQPHAPPAAPAAAVAPAAPAVAPGPLPDFAGEPVSQDTRKVANWAFYTRDAGGKSVVILDKKAARVHVFDPAGKLLASTPALLGKAIGDDSAPGIGDKPLSQVKEEEKTTPAGRFVAEPGENANGEDIIWIDYDAAVSMHRVRPLVAAERRLQRLASPTGADNRISFGCVNLPVRFYEGTLSPIVKRTGAIVYVLPETRSVEETFGAWDVTDPQARPPRRTVAMAAADQDAADARAPKQEREATP